MKRLEAPRWLSGGASKLQVAFKLRWRGENGSASASRWRGWDKSECGIHDPAF